MGRAERRREVARFRSETRTAGLVSYLCTPDDDRLKSAPLLTGAIAFWRRLIQTRRPICICCRTSFAADDVTVGAVLLAHHDEIAPKVASTSGICATCWTSTPMEQIEAAAMRVLAQLR